MTNLTTNREVLDFRNINIRELHDIYLQDETLVSKSQERAFRNMFFHEYTSYPHVPIGSFLSQKRSQKFEESADELLNNSLPIKQRQLFINNSHGTDTSYTTGSTLTFGRRSFGTPNPLNMLFGLRYSQTLFVVEDPPNLRAVALSGFMDYKLQDLYLIDSNVEFEVTKVEYSDIRCSRVLYCRKFYDDIQFVHLKTKTKDK